MEEVFEQIGSYLADHGLKLLLAICIIDEHHANANRHNFEVLKEEKK